MGLVGAVVATVPGACRRATRVIQYRWRLLFQRRQAAAVQVQRAARGFLARRALARLRAAAVLIQVRGTPAAPSNRV